MPTYEYVCTACDNHWEEVQKISENALEVCPACGKSTAKRQISAGNFILKGGGWYADLYSSSPKKAPDAAKTESSGKETAGSTSNGTANAAGASAGKSDAGSSASTSTTPAAPAPTPAKTTPGSGNK